MSSWLNHSKFIYIVSNLLVLPATCIPSIDLISNISFFIAFFFFLNNNLLVSLILFFTLLIKNNSNYRFNLLLIHKGEEVSKTDYECVYLYAWCTLLRYFLIGLAVNRICLFFE